MKPNPPLQGVKIVGNNMIEMEHGDITVLYSYETPVAIFAPSGLYRTSTHHSTTTAKHISKWGERHGFDMKGAAKIPQEKVDEAAQKGADPIRIGVVVRRVPGRSHHQRNPHGRKLTVPEQHQLKIARQTLRMSDAGARIMGGMTKEEARQIVAKLTSAQMDTPDYPGHKPNPHMERQVFQNDGWVIETDAGDFASPDFDAADVDDIRSAIGTNRKVMLGDSVYGRVENVTYLPKKTWWGRLSAPGYLDATDYVYGDSERDVNQQLDDLYGEEEESEEE